MAGIADQLLGVASQTAATDYKPDIGGDLNKGAELAQHIENIQQSRALLEQKKQELQQQKLDKYMSLIETGSKMDPGPAKQAFMSDGGYVSQYAKAIGIDGLISQPMMKMVQTDPAFGPVIKSAIGDGTISRTQVLNWASSPDGPQQMFDTLGDRVKQFKAMQNLGQSLQDVGLSQGAQDAEKERIQNEAGVKKMQAMIAPREEQVKIASGTQAAAAVKQLENNVELRGLKNQFRNVQKASSFFSDPNKPPNMTQINEIAQDMSAALSNARVSSDFKLKEINRETLMGRIADAKAAVKSDPDQAAPPEVARFWQDMANRLHTAYHNQIGAQAEELGQTAPTVYKDNPAAVKAVQDTVASYKSGKWAHEEKFDVAGKQMSRDQAIAFANKHTELADDPRMKKLKQDLGL